MKSKLLCLTVCLIIFPILLFSQEDNPIDCSDGIDNDGDGQIDCSDDECINLANNGCSTCFYDGLSFADTVLLYEPTCVGNGNDNPLAALGVSDHLPNIGASVTLGERGSITLGFINNILVNSGNNSPDLWVFEAGHQVESSRIELRPFDQNTISILNLEGITDSDSDGFYDFGIIQGSTASLDIEKDFNVTYPFSTLKFDAVQITDAPPGHCFGNSPGADIDAVCALSSINIDCEGIPNGMAIFDDCGECLEPTDPGFNQSCIDCEGMPNGTAILDDCGECLEPTDPGFNQSCIDCEGIPNGTAILDDCGECLEPTDPGFNQSCIDCEGMPNGTAILDDCGECLEPTDPGFNQSCKKVDSVYYPNVFSPNGDGINDKFTLFTESNSLVIESLHIFNRWGAAVFNNFNFEPNVLSIGWDGTYKGQDTNPGIFTFFAEILLANGQRKVIGGDVLLIR